ncbi:MAG: tetratricopeptide repeat protein [Bryobacterales bacterium]|nr:tetratricopeptide repeat protein [Bryobacterales bacterium]
MRWLGFLLAVAAWAQMTLDQAMDLASKGKFAEAERALLGLEKSQPEDLEVRFRLGLILLRNGKVQEASARFEGVVKANPDVATVWLAVAQTRLKLGDSAGAVEAIQRAEKLSPQDPPVWRAAAMIYEGTGDVARAIGFQERWLRVAPNDMASQLRLARLYEASKDSAKAVRIYQEAIDRAPEQWPPYAGLVELLLAHRTSAPALTVLEAAAERFAKNPEYWRLLGLAQYQMGDIGKALDAFLRISEIAPDEEMGYASLETLLADAGDRRGEIVRRLRGFRTRKPGSPIGHYLLARCLLLEGDRSLTVAALLRQALQADAGFWPAAFELGQLLEEQGKTAEALPLLRRVIQANAEYAPAHYSLSRIYARQGNRALAVEHRKRHGELVDKEREAAERARTENPVLDYRVEKGR